MKKITAVILAVLFSSAAQADFRYYGFSYMYMTMIPGFVEVELYNTYIEPVQGHYGSAYWERQIELEVGVSDWADFSFYLTDSRLKSSDSFNTTEVKARGRLKLTEKKGDFIFDPLLYVEYRFRHDRLMPDTWEIRGVMAKDIGEFNAVLNLIAEEMLINNGMSKAFVFEYTAGMSYPVYNDMIRLGIESTGDFNNNKYHLGPVLSFKGKSTWLAVSALYGLNQDSNFIKIQAVGGVVFDLEGKKE